MKWGYTDFASSLSKDKYFGYGVHDIDTYIGYEIINADNEIYYGFNRCEEKVAIRPSMKYSYVKEFVSDSKN